MPPRSMLCCDTPVCPSDAADQFRWTVALLTDAGRSLYSWSCGPLEEGRALEAAEVWP